MTNVLMTVASIGFICVAVLGLGVIIYLCHCIYVESDYYKRKETIREMRETSSLLMEAILDLSSQHVTTRKPSRERDLTLLRRLYNDKRVSAECTTNAAIALDLLFDTLFPPYCGNSQRVTPAQAGCAGGALSSAILLIERNVDEYNRSIVFTTLITDFLDTQSDILNAIAEVTK